ncbi:MAG: hypothetical protein Q8O00_10420, partial [Holophaga sp.]|nr:hypothetical protein [Holophaga sp.]
NQAIQTVQPLFANSNCGIRVELGSDRVAWFLPPFSRNKPVQWLFPVIRRTNLRDSQNRKKYATDEHRWTRIRRVLFCSWNRRAMAAELEL